MPLWLNLILIFLLLGIQLKAWHRYTGAFKSGSKRTGSRLVDICWPPRMSNLLILSGAGYYVYDCLWHPPFGASRLSICLSSFTMGLGFFCRNWDE